MHQRKMRNQTNNGVAGLHPMRRVFSLVLVAAGLAGAVIPSEQRMEKIEFRGNDGIRSGRIKAVMAQKVGKWGTPQSFRPRLLRQDSLAILSLYRREGYLRARVDSVRVYGGQKVMERFFITENERHRLLGLEFIGCRQLSPSALRAVIELKPKLGLQKAGYDPSQIPGDSLSILSLYQTRGFLDAGIDSIQRRSDSTHGVQISYFIRENARYMIDSVAVTGQRFLSEAGLRASLGIEKGEALDFERLGTAQLAVARRYMDEGFLDAQMEIDYTRLPGGYVDLQFKISEGRRLRVAGLEVYGNQQTKSAVIRNAFPIGAGEWINYSRIMHGQKRLYETGIFSSVSVELEPLAEDSSWRTVAVHVRERKASSLEFGGGYATEEGWRALSGISANNVRGKAVKASLQLQVNDQKSSVRFGYGDPWIFGSQLKGSLGAGMAFINDTTNIEIEAGASRPIGNSSELGLSYLLEFGNLDTASQDVYNGALHWIVRHDTRNDLFQTLRGRFVQMDVEYAAPATFSAFRYFKTTLDTRFFLTPVSDLTFGLRMQGGTLRSLGRLPTSALFRAGGDQSVRGYPLDSIPTQIDASFGSAGMLVGNFEVRKGIWGKWAGAIFADGAVFSKGEDFSGPMGSAASAGAGVRYSFSLGVLRLDWATQLQQPRTDPNGSWYFALGHSF